MKSMSILLGISFFSGAVNSLRKQNNLETKMLEPALTSRGLQNLQTAGCITLFATPVIFSSSAGMIIAGSLARSEMSQRFFI